MDKSIAREEIKLLIEKYNKLIQARQNARASNVIEEVFGPLKLSHLEEI